MVMSGVGKYLGVEGRDNMKNDNLKELGRY